MYHLIVSSLLSDLEAEDTVEVTRSRFLEHTSESIAIPLRTLSIEALTAMRTWPSLLMPEGRGDEQAYVGVIHDIRIGRGDIGVAVHQLTTSRPIQNVDVWKYRTLLDIDQFEFSRHHWAVKDRDLLSVLAEAGIVVQARDALPSTMLGLPGASRANLLNARSIVGEWGHTEIDDLLLEIGIRNLEAGRDKGSRRDRANAIVHYILDHPDSITAENHFLSDYFVRAAGESRSTPRKQSESQPASPPQSAPFVRLEREAPTPPNRVFVVHGRDEAARRAVVEYLVTLGLQPIVLHEQPNMGRHLLTKFIDEAELVTFAVILMTADDVGGLSASALRPRARQNVILELGYFISHLGRPNVCALVAPSLEAPSDFDGVVYIQMADDERWKSELRRELVAADMPVI